MTEQEKEEMLKDRKELAKKKGVSYLEVYCGNCEHGKGLYDDGWLCCEFLFNHFVEEYSYCLGWTKRKDMVEVVRCKDCKHLMTYNDGTYDCKYLVERMFAEGELNNEPNDFCCWGERKEVEE